MQRDEFCKYLEGVMERLSQLKKAVENNDVNEVYGFINTLRTIGANLHIRAEDCARQMQKNEVESMKGKLKKGNHDKQRTRRTISI